MGETRVDLLHLLEDLRDAYPGSLEETILTEIVANSLDSGATCITFRTDHAGATLTATDNGRGMTRRELRRYHDLATTTKQRGRGIGFAGVGIKLGLLACDTVLTESCTGKVRIATQWHLMSKHRAPWKWVEPPGLADGHGTAVCLTIANPLSELLDEGFIEETLRRHFQPLFESGFDAILAAHYRAGVRFVVNGRELARETGPPGGVQVQIRLPRKRKPAAAGYLYRADAVLPESARGVAVSTLGKVIKRGWDWLGLTPAGADRIGGLIEAPALADCLTLNKADFLRTGPRGATYLAYRKAIQEALAEPLAAWGDAQDRGEPTRRRQARPLERDLRNVLAELSHEFPLLAALTEPRSGGQRRLPLGGGGRGDASSGALEVFAAPRSDAPQVAMTTDGDEGAEGAVEPPVAEPQEPPPREPPLARAGAALPGAARKRRGHLALRIDFERRPDEPTLGRLVETTIWVNEAHPAFQRAQASRLQAYHLAVTVAMTLAPLAVESPHVHEFVAAFLERWGAAGPKGR